MARVVETLHLRKQEPLYPIVVNIIAVDDLATHGARAAAAMVLIYFCWDIPVSAPGVLVCKVYGQSVKKYIAVSLHCSVILTGL